MSIDVVHFRWIDAGIGQRGPHRRRRTAAFGIRRSDMVGVGGTTQTAYVPQNWGAAILGSLIVLQQEEGGTFSEREPLTIAVEGSARRVGEKLQRMEAAVRQPTQRIDSTHQRPRRSLLYE